MFVCMILCACAGYRYKCEGQVLTVSSASALLDTGRYCCDIASNGAGIEASVCLDVQVILGGESLNPQHWISTSALLH